jgi:hypothetical protein
MKILQSLFQDIGYSHPNICTIRLLLPEGPVGEAWKISNKKMPFLPPH